MERRWLTVKETARYLGLHYQSIYRLISNQRIPFSNYKGIGIRIDKIELDKQLKARESIPKDFSTNKIKEEIINE